MTDTELTITHVAGRAGIRPSAIRYCESIGLLPAPTRVNGRRRYDEGVLQRLAIIATAQRMGFTTAEIGTLLHGFDAETPAWIRWQTLARDKLPEIEALIAHAQGMKRLLEASLRCECLTVAECVTALRARYQREATPVQ
jgi:MerR family transcriptional regulator, redox-sensitive transcriptional activator SoxR